MTPIHTAGAVLALVERDPAGARRHVDAGLADLGEMDPLYTPPLLTSGIRAEAELADLASCTAPPGGRRRGVVARQAARGRRGPDRRGAPGRAAGRARPPGARPRRGGTRQWEPAVERWAEAARRFLDLGEPYPAAYAQLRQAEALLAERRAPRGGAVARLRRPDGTRALGRRRCEPKSRPLARRARLKLASPAADIADVDGGPAGLTSREEEVLRLLADGLTNREIGRRLFISAEDRRHARRTHLPKSWTCTRGSRPPAAPSSSASSTAPADATLVHGDLHLRGSRYPLLAPPGGTPGRES